MAQSEALWKDYRLNLGTADGQEYTIKLDDVVIYSGTAYLAPGAANIEISVNEIFADYFPRIYPAMESLTPYPYTQTFAVEWASTSAYLTFRNDWSYDENFDPEVDGLSFPIDGRVDRRQTFLYTEVLTSGDTIPTSWVNKDGSTGSGELGPVENSGATVFPVIIFSPDIVSFTVGMRTYKVVDCGGDYVLHYMNAYGGWDSLLVSGNGKATDTIKHYTFGLPGKSGAASVEERRTKENYVNDITRKYTLHTGVLTEDQSLRMHHLLESPLVMLQDLTKGRRHRVPVVLTGNSCEFKTYKNNGRKLMEYTIECELAETRMRR